MVREHRGDVRSECAHIECPCRVRSLAVLMLSCVFGSASRERLRSALRRTSSTPSEHTVLQRHSTMNTKAARIACRATGPHVAAPEVCGSCTSRKVSENHPRHPPKPGHHPAVRSIKTTIVPGADALGPEGCVDTASSTTEAVVPVGAPRRNPRSRILKKNIFQSFKLKVQLEGIAQNI